MIDLRPIAYILGLLLVVLGGLMLLPLALDRITGHGNWLAFLSAATITTVTGAVMALTCANANRQGLTVKQAFVLTTAVWTILPAFGAVPFMLGEPGLGVTDAYFEAVSGMTTTGTTIIGPDAQTGAPGLDLLPMGTNLWRGMLQWLGGLGIVIVALIFLPVMKVGGMQFFRSEGFDTLGKILPRAFEISVGLIQIYALITVACALAFKAMGMSGFEAVMHALTCVSTGGFSTRDASFGAFSGAPQLVAVLFMLMASLPFIRYVQVMRGDVAPLFRDIQVRAFLRWNAVAVGLILFFAWWQHEIAPDRIATDVLFNVVTVFTGTGYGSADVTLWGAFAFTVLLTVGLIGGCTSSTVCSVKVFRYLILIEAVKVQLRRLRHPSAAVQMRYGGHPVSDDVLDSVIMFFTLFVLTFGLLVVALSLSGLSDSAALTGAWTSLANIGPVWGPEVGRTGAVDGFPVASKWLLIAGMILGRLELLSVYVLFMARFWRD